MDLTVHEEGTYDAVIRMVDNTSSQITSTSQCKQLASSLRSSIATNKGSEIKVKSIKGDEGIGCEFTFKSIPVATAATKPIPNASAASTANASGYAIGNGGMPWYSASRPWSWLIVGSVFALTAFGFWRRRRAHTS